MLKLDSLGRVKYNYYNIRKGLLFMWTSCFIISLLSILVLLIAWAFLRNTDFARKIKFNLFTALSAGAFLASACIYFPAVKATVPSGIPGTIYSFLVSAYNSAIFEVMGERLPPKANIFAELYADTKNEYIVPGIPDGTVAFTAGK